MSKTIIGVDSEDHSKQKFLQRRYTNGQEHMKRCPTLLALRERQIKMSEVPLHTQKDGYDKKKNNKCWGGCGEMFF